MGKRQPHLVRLGNLNTVVREHGRNNDDGNGWTIKVEEERRPPAPLRRGLLAFLFTH